MGHKDEAVYLNLSEKTREEITEELTLVRDTCREYDLPLIAHNLFFDGSCVANYLGSVRGDSSGGPAWLPYKFCTFSLLSYLSSEGFVGQTRSLKFAMENLLLWEDTNEVKRDEWLISHGYVSGPGGISLNDSEEIKEAKLEKIRQAVADGKSKNANKSLMYLCPPEILGEYCAYDTYATYHLYRQVLLPAMQKYTTTEFFSYQSGVMLDTIRAAIDNYQRGIKIDEPRLLKFKDKLEKDTEKSRLAIYKAYKKEIADFNKDSLKAFKESYAHINRYVNSKPLPKEPKKYTKAGKLSKSWINWHLRQKKSIRDKDTYSKSWLKKHAQYKLLKKAMKLNMCKDSFLAEYGFLTLSKYLFNVNSVDHKRQIIYSDIDVKILDSYRGSDRGERGLLRVNNQFEIEYTASGEMPTGKEAIMAIGGRASTFNAYNRILKQGQFVQSTLNNMHPDTRMLHMPIKIPGTNTQRLAGDGGLNLQNLIKSAEFLACWIPRSEDNVIAQLDFASMEPHTLTAFSRDEVMLSLYGPNAKPHDVYIYTGVLMGGLLGDPFIKLGYDVNNPTKEIVAACKKKYKNLRNVLKTLVLSDDYGSGAKKKYRTLKLQKFDFTYAQVEEMHNRLAEVYAGKKALGEKLEKEWKKNGGFILDGFGFPICVDKSKTKDLTNRLIQRSSHMILNFFISRVMRKFWEQEIGYDWMIFDFHDEIIPEIHQKHVEAVKQIYAEAMDWLNDELLQTDIRHKGSPEFCHSLAGVKLEGYQEEDEDIRELLEELNG